MDFFECSFLKLRIWRQSKKARQKFEKGVLDKSRCALEKFFGIEQEKNQSRKGAPRENSWYIVLTCFPSELTGVDTAGIYRAT